MAASADRVARCDGDGEQVTAAATALCSTPTRAAAAPKWYTPTLAVGKPVTHVRQAAGKIGAVKKVF